MDNWREAATIEHGGRKHIECTSCGETFTDCGYPAARGEGYFGRGDKAEIGGYPVIPRTRNNKPVFNSEITIDKDDKYLIRLTENRLLDFADRTTVTVFNTENQTAATGLNIFVADDNGNNATGVTDESGQFTRPTKILNRRR